MGRERTRERDAVHVLNVIMVLLCALGCVAPPVPAQAGSPTPPRTYEQRRDAAVDRLAAARELAKGGDDADALRTFEQFFSDGHGVLVYSHTDALEEAYEEWAALAEQVGDLRSRISVTTARGDLQMARGALSSGYGMFLEAAALLPDEEPEGWDPWVELRLQRRLGNAAWKLGRPEARTASAAFGRAAGLAEQVGARDELALVLSLSGLLVWDLTQQTDQALPLARQALAVLDEAADTDELIDSRTLKNCADIFKAAHEVARAESLYLRCLETSNDPATRVAAHGLLGQMLVRQGRFSEARRHLAQSIEAAEGPVSQGLRLDSEVTLATLEWALGNLDAAQEMFDRLIPELERFGKPESARVARINRANILLVRERYAEAEPVYRTLVEESVRAGDLAQRLAALNNLGIVLQGLARFDEAAAVFQELHDLSEETGADAYRAGALIGLAEVRVEQGLPRHGEDEADVLRMLEDAVETYDALRRPLDALNAIDSMVCLHLEAGRLEDVEAALVDVEQRMGAAEVSELLTYERASVRSVHAGWGRLAQDLVLAATAADAEEVGSDGIRRGPAVLEGWRRAGLWKSRALLEGVRPSALAAGGDRAEAQRAAAMGLLREGEVLIDYCVSTERLLAYVLHRDELLLLDLGDRAPIEERAAGFAAMLSTPGESTLAQALEAGAALYADLLEDVVTHLGGLPERVTVLPTSELARVPFEALVVDAKEPVFVLDRSQVRYGPSTAVLCALAQRGDRRDPAPALLLGDARYEGEDAADSRTAAWAIPVLRRLPKSRAEVVNIARQLIKAQEVQPDPHRDRLQDMEDGSIRDGSLVADPVSLRVGSDVNASCLDGPLERYGLLHFAVHALVHPEDPRRTGLVFSFDPETRGLVGLPRILTLSLDDPVVVLSACRTADGAIIAGEGVQSLAAAFLEAGARTAVASLWVVDDRDAASVMETFYEAWISEGLSPGDALRRAKLALRTIDSRGGSLGPTSTTRHPRFWATFILTGLD